MANSRVNLKEIVLLFCFFVFKSSQALSCTPCEQENCEELVCEGSRVLGPCGCCEVCAKQEGEICGGSFNLAGVCDFNLKCVVDRNNGVSLQDFIANGICKYQAAEDCEKQMFVGCNLVKGECECGLKFACSNPYQFSSQHLCYVEQNVGKPNLDKCANTNCPNQTSPVCPEDSRLVKGNIPNGECCSVADYCECKSCEYMLCSPGTEMIVVVAGSGSPGSCCDEIVCRPRENNDCATVRCNYSLDKSCPSDSAAVAGRIPFGQCCPGAPVCQCLNSECERPACPETVSLKILYKSNGNPGSCCDVFTCSNDPVEIGCSVNGTRYQNGDYYLDRCQRCQCKMGISHCKPQSCPPVFCQQVILAEGACCPVCISEKPDYEFEDYPSLPQPLCYSRDKTQAYSVGQNWTSDACTFCTCTEGGIPRCKAAFCREPNIMSTTFPCPELTECSLENSDCPNGFARDPNGCNLCLCSDDHNLCPLMDTCHLHCPRGYVTDHTGCTSCKCKQRKCKKLSMCKKQCPYGYKRNKKGCSRCKCRHCPPLDTCSKECQNGLAQNRFGCKICRCLQDTPTVPETVPSKGCVDPTSSRFHDDGETWSSDCYICVCRGGLVMCDLLKCPELECDDPKLEEGACCATCPGSAQIPSFIPQSQSCNVRGENKVWIEGDVRNFDVCTTITCHDGHLMATTPQCPPAACENPVYNETSCCPKCLVPTKFGSCDHGKACRSENGSIYENGSEFKIDSCTSCKCDNGVIKCYAMKCAFDPQCTSPVVRRGECCPKCLELPVLSYASCNIIDKIYFHGEEWSNNSTRCEMCICLDGKVTCKDACCPSMPLNCQETRFLENSCCQECILLKHPVINPAPPSKGNTAASFIPVICAGVIFLILIVIFVIFRKRICKRTRGVFKIRNTKKVQQTDYLFGETLLDNSTEKKLEEA